VVTPGVEGKVQSLESPGKGRGSFPYTPAFSLSALFTPAAEECRWSGPKCARASRANPSGPQDL
jgi:hypothetical protein